MSEQDSSHATRPTPKSRERLRPSAPCDEPRRKCAGQLDATGCIFLTCHNTRVELRAYSTYLAQHDVRLPPPRTLGRIFHGTSGGRADGTCQHAGHPPRRDRRLAPYPRLRNRLRRRRSNSLLPGPPRRSLSLFRPVQPDSPDRPSGRRRNRPASAGDLLPCPRRQGAPAGLRQRSTTLGRRHCPRASSRRCRLLCYPDYLQPLSHDLLGWRHLQSGFPLPIPSSAPKPPGGGS